MKKILFSFIFFFSCLSSCAQSETKTDDTDNIKIPIFKMFPTENMWTFLKLDTRNGRIWQVHFSVSKENERGEIVLNDKDLIWDGHYLQKGRFTLLPTKNMYNFILLDQVKGDTYQVQWSFDEENRGVIPIPLL